MLREAEKHESNYKLYSGFNKKTDKRMTNDFHVLTKTNMGQMTFRL